MHYGRITMKLFEVLLSLRHTKFNFVIVSCVFLAATLAAGPGRADVHAGVEAYKKGDYKTALREFVDLAESGDPRAQYNLAVMYLKGRGVEKNLARAFDLQQRAAKGGLAAAQHGLAIMYYRGEGAERDYRKAAEWFRRAADRGFPTSQLNLGVMYFSGQGVKRNDAEVVKWITLAAAKGLPEALFRLGRMYEEGAIFAQSTQDAIYWYGKSSERGHADGEKQVKRLKALLAARQATTDVGKKDTAATEHDAKKADAPAMATKHPVLPAPPEVSAAPVDTPPEPKIVKSVPKMSPQPEPQSESKPEIRVWRAQLA
ncbi:MAG: SEL1-like repeat protein, partial [Rhodospirillales bacterium]|nr:SEL1-like repeat protein [Rhodospirillales bacterium]